jgi:lipopolysaccharide/colanic/teichoic acid biosynthesis glycosyltransferase
MRDITDDTMASDTWSFETAIAQEASSKKRAAYLASKRVFDLLLSCAALPVFAMLCAVIYVLNAFWNPGPLFFRQERMGKEKSKFAMVKFRTMRSEESVAKRGPFDALEEWRITPFGRWMRRTRLDEVPQILNVIVGQMSLIGPRPENFEFAEAYYEQIPGYQLRGTIRPGITGYAQVKQGYTDTEEAVRVKTKLDTFYVRHMNWWLDLKVLFWTVSVVFSSRGAR